MFTKILKVLFVSVCLVFLAYLALPNPDFPVPPPDSIQSKEPADTETPLRRAYFTNYSREQVLSWYKTQFDHSRFLNLELPTYLLNHPPEDAQTIIRDQTRTSYLEEVVHPFRESVYINGFEPGANSKDAIFIEGRSWKEKIIIRYVPSSIIVRILVLGGIIFFTVVLFEAFKKSCKNS